MGSGGIPENKSIEFQMPSASFNQLIDILISHTTEYRTKCTTLQAEALVDRTRSCLFHFPSRRSRTQDSIPRVAALAIEVG